MNSQQKTLTPGVRVRHIRTNERGWLLRVYGEKRKSVRVRWDRGTTGIGWLDHLESA